MKISKNRTYESLYVIKGNVQLTGLYESPKVNKKATMVRTNINVLTNFRFTSLNPQCI